MEKPPHGIYVPPPKLTRHEILKGFASDDPERIINALFGINYRTSKLGSGVVFQVCRPLQSVGPRESYRYSGPTRLKTG
jgi:hypothetical protein